MLREDEEVLPFAAWWKAVDKDEVVEVQYPYDRHGLTGRPSNHSQQDVMREFLEFFDNNLQPNGHWEGSYSAHFFLPQLTRIVAPAEGEKILRRNLGHLLLLSLTGYNWKKDDQPVAPLL